MAITFGMEIETEMEGGQAHTHTVYHRRRVIHEWTEDTYYGDPNYGYGDEEREDEEEWTEERECEDYDCEDAEVSSSKAVAAASEVLAEVRRFDNRWEVVADCSLEAGAEIRTAWGTYEAWQGSLGETLEDVLAELQERNFTVSSHCGLHVHIGYDNWNTEYGRQLLLALWEHLPPMLEDLHEPYPSRVGDYCLIPDSVQREDIREMLADDDFSVGDAISHIARRYSRYLMLNLTCLNYHGTIEVRWFDGTLDFATIMHYLTALHDTVTECEAIAAQAVALQTATLPAVAQG